MLKYIVLPSPGRLSLNLSRHQLMQLLIVFRTTVNYISHLQEQKYSEIIGYYIIVGLLAWQTHKPWNGR